ncbi:MAG: AAA family ATPase [Desulfobacteraceae bacterium]|jgi:ATP-dependent Clp protease ATP-binding subunit ClpC
MSENSYKVTSVFLDSAKNFEILVMTLPEEELNDKLAYLASSKGNISKSYYEDFLITNCVANINQLLSYISNNSYYADNLLKVRAELLEEIFKYNPTLKPDNLIINKNSVVKVKTTKKPRANEILLTENDHWNTSYYEDAKTKDGGLNNKELNDDVANLKKKAGQVKNVDELEYEEKQVWWEQIRQYVKIKKFKEDESLDVISGRYFKSESSFHTYIVSSCLLDFEELFLTLDELGMTGKVTPPVLMKELYKLCVSINKKLTFKNAQEMFDGDEDQDIEAGSGQVRAKTGEPSTTLRGSKKKKKKRFKDVSKQDLLSLADNMKVFLIGQDEAIHSLTDAIQRASVGLKDPLRPIGSFLFAGSTGCGKTLTTKVLAETLIRERNNLITIDCSEYSSDHEYAKLIGAPSGYIGHEQGGILTNAMMKNPFSVVVFDEVEKASTKVHEIMLQILEEGRLTDGKGQRVSFKDAVVIMTSNVGVREIEEIGKTIGFGDVNKITDDKKSKALDEALKSKFKPEFLNRIDAIINFRTLNKEDYIKIIEIELFKLNENIQNNDTEYQGIRLTFDKSVNNYILKHGIDDKYGARPLKRCIEKEVSTPLARKILKERLTSKAAIDVKFKRGKIAFDIRDRGEVVDKKKKKVKPKGKKAC